MKKRMATSDFSSEMLPANRFQEFFDLLKNRYRTFLGLGALVFLFFIPLLFLLFWRDLNVAGVNYKLSINDISSEEAAISISSTMFYFGLVSLVGYPIIGLGLAGAARLMKHLIYGEPVFFWIDFRDGVKMHGKTFAGLAFLFGVFSFLNGYIGRLSSLSWWIRALPFGFSFVFLLPPVLLALSMETTYQMGFWIKIQNGYRIYFKHAPIMLVVLLAFILPSGFSFISQIYIKYIVISLFVLLLVVPLYLQGTMLCSAYLFDQDINRSGYPSFYHKGLRDNP